MSKQTLCDDCHKVIDPDDPLTLRLVTVHREKDFCSDFCLMRHMEV